MVLAIVFVAVAAPRASLNFRTKALQQLLAAVPPLARSVEATIDYPTLSVAFGYVPGAPGSQIEPPQIDSVRAELAGNLGALKLPLASAASQWSGLATSYSPVTSGAARSAYFGPAPPHVELLYRSDLGRFARIAAGSLPGGYSVAGRTPRFQVAVTAATAARFGLHPGSILHLGGLAELAVTGILRPAAPRSAFWTEDPNAAAASLNSGHVSVVGWLGGVFIGPAELGDLQDVFDTGQMRLYWTFPLDVRSLGAIQAAAVYDGLTRAIFRAGVLTRSVQSPMSVTVSSGMIGTLQTFVQAQSQIGSLLSLLYVSLAMVGAVVLLLASGLLADRRAAEFGLMRARGAAFRQLAGLALRAGLVVVLPAAVVGAALGVAVTPGDNEPLAWWLAGLTVLVAAVGIPVLAVRRTPATGLSTERPDSPPTRIGRGRRLVADVTLVAASVGGLVVLRQQGPPPPGGTDLYTSAAPVLVAIPLAVVVVRLYPAIVRWLVRLAGRRSGVTVFVGLARAARSSLTAVLPAFALVLALAVIAFGAMLRVAMARGQVAASWQQTGADAVIDTSHSNVPLGPAAQRAIAAVPGVQRATAVSVVAAQTADGTALTLLVVDPASYAALIADTPQPPFPASALARPSSPAGQGSAPAPFPAIVSRGAAAVIGRGARLLVGASTLPVRPVGTIAGTPAAIGSTDPFIVLPAWAPGPEQAQPNVMLVVGQHLDVARLQAVMRRVLPGASVTFRSALLDALAAAPLPRGTYVTFAVGSAAAALFGVAIMLIMLVLGARQRELTLARLATMGLSPGQARRLVAAETLPSILAATAGGVACALALVPLLAPVIDLSVLTGTGSPVPVRADLPVLGYAAAVLLALALATLFAQSAATRMRGAARALRVGE